MPKNNSEVADGDSEKKPSRKWLFILLAVFLSLSTLMGGLVMSTGVDKLMNLVTGGGDEEMDTEPHMDSDAVEHTAEADMEHSEVEPELVVMPFKEIIVNIVSITQTGRKSTRFLKLNVALVFDQNIQGSEHISEREVYMRDAFQNYLRQLTERDLSGSIGIVRLKSELLRRARAVAESDAPRELLIADIIVQ